MGVKRLIIPLPTISFSEISATMRSVSASACAAIPSSASMASSSSLSLEPSFDSASAFFLLFPDDVDSCFLTVLAAFAQRTELLNTSLYMRTWRRRGRCQSVSWDRRVPTPPQ